MNYISFKAAARNFRNQSHAWMLGQTAANICNMAHAITRGRNPSVPIGNARVWWRDRAFNYNCGLTDYTGEPCDIFSYLYEMANECCDDPAFLSLRESVSLCWRHFERVGWPKVKLTEEDKSRRHEEWLDRKEGRHGYFDEYFQHHNYDDDQDRHHFDDEMIL